MMVAAQTRHPHLRLSFTLATLAASDGDQSGINAQGQSVLTAIRTVGLDPFFINLMVMDYGPADPANCVVQAGRCDMVAFARQAVRNLHAVHGVPLSRIEVTAMLGVNDVVENVVTPDDATALARWVRQERLGGLHFWSLDRDTPCPGGATAVSAHVQQPQWPRSLGIFTRLCRGPALSLGMPSRSNIQPITHAGHSCLQLSTRHGVAIVALHGGQVLSWVPKGLRDVFWLSPTSRPAPAAIRGGVPICWPWFGKQGMPEGAMQHGPVRNRPWEVVRVQEDHADGVSLTLAPCPTTLHDYPLARFAPSLALSLQIDLGETLVQTLQTQNKDAHAFGLTQALHSYFAVSAADQVQVAELAGVPFDDKLTGATGQLHAGPFTLDQACDRVYQHPLTPTTHRYTLEDRGWQRRIHVTTLGSQSLVVWNPGQEQACQMVDVPDAAWIDFLCLEAANAGADVIALLPSGMHQLTQTLTVEAMSA